MYTVQWIEDGKHKSETYCAYSTNYSDVVDYAKTKADKNTNVIISSI